MQVEVIGDAYVVAGGLLETEKKDHITAIVDMAFAMRDQTALIKSPRKDIPLQVHTHTYA